MEWYCKIKMKIEIIHLRGIRVNGYEREDIPFPYLFIRRVERRWTCWPVGSVPDLVLLHKSLPKELLHHLVLCRK